MKALDFGCERRQWIGLHGIHPAHKMRGDVAHETRHVTHDLSGCPRPVAGAERRIMRWGAAQRFLRAIGDGGKEVAQQLAIAIHLKDVPPRTARRNGAGDRSDTQRPPGRGPVPRCAVRSAGG